MESKIKLFITTCIMIQEINSVLHLQKIITTEELDKRRNREVDDIYKFIAKLEPVKESEVV